MSLEEALPVLSDFMTDMTSSSTMGLLRFMSGVDLSLILSASVRNCCFCVLLIEL